MAQLRPYRVIKEFTFRGHKFAPQSVFDPNIMQCPVARLRQMVSQRLLEATQAIPEEDAEKARVKLKKHMGVQNAPIEIQPENPVSVKETTPPPVAVDPSPIRVTGSRRRN